MSKNLKNKLRQLPKNTVYTTAIAFIVERLQLWGWYTAYTSRPYYLTFPPPAITPQGLVRLPIIIAAFAILYTFVGEKLKGDIEATWTKRAGGEDATK